MSSATAHGTRHVDPPSAYHQYHHRALVVPCCWLWRGAAAPPAAAAAGAADHAAAVISCPSLLLHSLTRVTGLPPVPVKGNATIAQNTHTYKRDSDQALSSPAVFQPRCFHPPTHSQDVLQGCMRHLRQGTHPLTSRSTAGALLGWTTHWLVAVSTPGVWHWQLCGGPLVAAMQHSHVFVAPHCHRPTKPTLFATPTHPPPPPPPPPNAGLLVRLRRPH